LLLTDSIVLIVIFWEDVIGSFVEPKKLIVALFVMFVYSTLLGIETNVESDSDV
jgi:hypothetical protein